MEEFEEAALIALSKNHKKIEKYKNSDYEKAKEFVKLFGKEKLAEYEKKEPKLIEAIKRTAEAERERQFKDKSLELEMILNTHSGIKLFVPAKCKNGNELENDLVSHVEAVYRDHDPMSETGK